MVSYRVRVEVKIKASGHEVLEQDEVKPKTHAIKTYPLFSDRVIATKHGGCTQYQTPLPLVGLIILKIILA